MIPAVTVPVGTRGPWAVERFEVTEHDAKLENLRAMFGSGRPIHPGTYTRLTYRGHVVMSDTPAEKHDHWWPVHNARGHCLVTGLGLGVVADAMLLRPEVTKVTVVEIDADVIALVAPHYRALYGERFEAVLANAYQYQPAAKVYGVVWHDIWPAICSDNLPEMTRLKRKYGRRAERQGCWCEAECRRYARAGR
jgi:hypothetical protein